MKLRKEESIPKLDKCRAFFKNDLLVAQDLWGPKTTRNCVAVKLAYDSAAKGCSKSQRCVKPGPRFTALQDIGKLNAAEPFQSNSSSV